MKGRLQALLRYLGDAWERAIGAIRSRLRWPDPEANARTVGMALGVVAAANLVLFLFVSRPLYRNCQMRGTEWEAIKGRIGQRQRSVERMGRQRRHLERERENLERFHDEILSEKFVKMTTIQREIRKLATQFQINPENIAYSPAYLEDQELVYFGISFPLRGSYENLRQFIQRVEISPNFLIIDDISLAGGREGGVTLNLNVMLHTYFKDHEYSPEGRGRS
ncbi:MAG: hypothetical protein V3U98_10725 [Acidobacteriota bacterium]